MFTNPLIKTGGTPAMPKRTMAPSSIAIAKLISKGQQQGNPGISQQQFTEREIFDYLPFDGREIFTFFQNVKNRTFPFTNLEDNKLQPGEMMILKRVFFTIMTINPVTGGVTNVSSFSAAGLSGLNQGIWNFFNDNVRVVKEKGTLSHTADFNKQAYNTQLNTYTLESEITIPTLVSFTATLQVSPYTPIANTYIGMHSEGIGTILNPKNTY